MPAHDWITASTNLDYVEQLYNDYLLDPNSVDPTWRAEFDQWHRLTGGDQPLRIRPSFTPRSIFSPRPSGNGNGHAPSRGAAPPDETREEALSSLQHRVDQLVRNFRVRGHIAAQLDPLGGPPADVPEISPAYYGFTEADMDRPFTTNIVPGKNRQTLREIIQHLRNTYCRYIGVQFMHIDSLGVREWLQQRMEGTENRIELTRKQQIRILTRLTDATIFEQFIQRKFIGAKSFSLEGAETLIPLLDMALEKAGDQGAAEVVIGMAHRGRLNVLANIIGKSPHRIFREFEDIDPQRYIGGGDVKYHLGESGDWRTRHGRNIHLSLCFNPSHLEFVNPVVLGRLRAKQDRSGEDTRGERGLAVLIHGDASFIGEGIVQETLNLSMLDGYRVGGTLHIIVNNQIGFTTGPQQGRSSFYASDVAKMLQIPIFHVNGEAPEAVAQVINLAMDFRRQFKRDVVIDMYCYRRRGHNEGDEPSYTQPRMYEAIERRPTVREAYLEHLLKLGGVSESDAERIARRRTELLEKELTAARSESYTPRSNTSLQGIWAGYVGGKEKPEYEVDTTVPRDRLATLLEAQARVPESFHPHPKIKKLLKLRREMAAGKRPLDWATAEALAFGSLAVEGHRIRMSGQDCERGTFSQRHSVLHDTHDDSTYMPLQHLADNQAPVEIINSPLSEAGVLGFEYGYSLDCPEGLILWEAQFGDFVNAAQVIIDQFIASAEDKWRRLSGITLLLPHGFEGQGPEHSSARLERFLMLSAEQNIQVVQPTTPAQYFHVLRRQVMRHWRKPLVVMTPKSLLRLPDCSSTFDDLAGGGFSRVLSDPSVDPERVKRVLLCSGKVYYDLASRRAQSERDDVAIIRIEQLYPLPYESLKAAMEPYADETPVFWVQEEPGNMGAWQFLKTRFCRRLLERYPFEGVYRPKSSSPATGSRSAHQIEQERLLAAAFGEESAS